jgi:prepilin-type N-terminal cleavage/methylation domain-containing protein
MFVMKVVRRSLRQSGFSLVELLIVIAIILIILAFAVPKLTSARMQAQETAAIKAIDTINTAQQQYYSQFGRYASNLQELGPPTSGNSGPAAADLIGGDLATGTKQGYVFTMSATPGGYTVNANPVTFNSTGRRTFYTDQSLVKRENWGQEPASATSKEIGSVAAKTN